MECPRFEPKRLNLQCECRILPTWWAHQPRMTSKSGWITLEAATCTDRRVALQIAACRVALAVFDVFLDDDVGRGRYPHLADDFSLD